MYRAPAGHPLKKLRVHEHSDSSFLPKVFAVSSSNAVSLNKSPSVKVPDMLKDIQENEYDLRQLMPELFRTCFLASLCAKYVVNFVPSSISRLFSGQIPEVLRLYTNVNSADQEVCLSTFIF
ncbi:hypothetical protein RCL1_008302 [Eukaryota sp. TZLM3-RCL]